VVPEIDVGRVEETVLGVVLISDYLVEVRVLMHRKVSAEGPDESVPSTLLPLLSPSLIPIPLVMRLISLSLLITVEFLGNHSWVWLVIRSSQHLVPLNLSNVSDHFRKQEAPDGDGDEESSAEGLPRQLGGLHVGEIWHEALDGHDGHPASRFFHLAPSPDADGDGEGGTHHHVDHESELVIVLDLAIVLPGPPLGA